MTVTILNVITSTRLEAAVQIDGRFAVRELHQANGGESEHRFYLADPGADLDAMLAANGRAYLTRLARK